MRLAPIIGVVVRKLALGNVENGFDILLCIVVIERHETCDIAARCGTLEIAPVCSRSHAAPVDVTHVDSFPLRFVACSQKGGRAYRNIAVPRPVPPLERQRFGQPPRPGRNRPVSTVGICPRKDAPSPRGFRYLRAFLIALSESAAVERRVEPFIFIWFILIQQCIALGF